MQKRHLLLTSMLVASVTLVGCKGDKGSQGEQGVPGATGPAGPAGVVGGKGSEGAQGLTSLIVQRALQSGDENCFKGGIAFDSGVDVNRNDTLDSEEITDTQHQCGGHGNGPKKAFNRIASFLVCSQIDANCNTDEETAAEIVAVTSDGYSLIYTDSPQNQVGFVDIMDPKMPMADGVVSLSGEPTSVAVVGDYALVGVNTSADFINVSGHLDVIDVSSKTILRSIDLGGQPDSVAVSPDGQWAAVVIENERDEDLGDGVPPQAPSGYLAIVSLSGALADWTVSNVDMTGIADLYSGDPEPEYVDINSENIAVVTLQENNYIILVDLTTGNIVEHFTAGSVDLSNIDTTEEDPALISLTENQDGRLREPDGVSWINNHYFATADEGDLDGGSRGFTVFDKKGNVISDAGNSLDHMAVRLGHYPDGRSGNKGNEPENIEVGIFGGERFMFVASERSSLIFAYDVADPTQPIYHQTLPAGAGPEGVLAIPSRNLMVAASEEDNRGDKIRSVINIYSYTANEMAYPTLESTDRIDGTPIPWGALSGLAAAKNQSKILYAVDDSFYQGNRIFTINTNKYPAKIVEEHTLMDSQNVLAQMPAAALADETVGSDDATRIDVFDVADRAALVNSDGSVNIDPEGISVAADGGFWVVSEGNGTVGDSGRPVNSLNMLIKTSMYGVIEQVVTLPDSWNQNQLRFGFEGVTEANGKVYVAFQRAWAGDTQPRLGIYDIQAGTWSYVFYPLEAAASQNGGWVGLSDISWIEDDRFLVLERDNQGGPDAAIKRIYEIDLASAMEGDTVSKTLVKDLMMDLKAPGGNVYEKIEGLAIQNNGDVYIVNDNDGVDDNSGEVQLINLGKLLN